MATAPSSAREKTNHTRLSRLLIDIGRLVLKDVFDSIHPPASLHGLLNSSPVQSQLGRLKSHRVIYTQQWDLLYPSSGTVDTKNFDITLLFLLLRNICGLSPPATGSWDAAPSSADTTMEADMVRIKRCRNELYAHKVEMALTDEKFDNNWDEIQAALNRLAGKNDYKEKIERLKYASLDHEKDTCFYTLLQSWEDDQGVIRKLDETFALEIQKVLAKLDGIADKKGSKVDEEFCQLMEKLLAKLNETTTTENIDKVADQQVLQEMQKLNKKLDDIAIKKKQDNILEPELYSQKLRHSIIQRTERQQKRDLSSIQSAKTDDIFTNLTLHHSKESHLQPKRAGIDHHAYKKLTEMKTCSDIFVDEKEENPKSILVAGDPGIGKTLFSHKIARDWAKDYVSIPNIKFTYLLTFRQLNDQQPLSLIELFNLSSLLNQTTMTNEAMMDYINEHPQQLLVIIDGLDEYEDRHKIASNFESKFPNDAKAKMPVAALISKLLHKKILRESVTMITSRVGEANELDKKIDFERYVQINGFSESQVLEYVEKYFNSKPKEMKNLALNKVKENEQYMTFGRIPFMAFLMCVVIEWEIANNLTSDNSDSLTLTEFYYQVIHCIEKNYNREISSLNEEDALSAVTKTLDNFSRLAAQLFQQKKFNFTDQDLKKLKLEENEFFFLKFSNLLCCNLVASNSPFPQTICEYSFNHYSFQEFFAARHFVSENKLPAEQEITELILQFMSGLMNPQFNEELMFKVLECISQQEMDLRRQRLVSMRCLFEFKDGSNVFTRVVSEDHGGRYWDSNGWIGLNRITDKDCKPVAMFVDRLASVSHKLTEPPHMVDISLSSLTRSGLQTLLLSLANQQTTIIRLRMYGCYLDDKCAECIGQYLPNTKITELVLGDNLITDKGIEYIINHDCLSNLTILNLWENELSDKCKQKTREFCQINCPSLYLEI